MKVIWRASLLKNCEQADQCNNFGENEEVYILALPCRELVLGAYFFHQILKIKMESSMHVEAIF